MPKLFRKTLVTLGTHQAPQRAEHVTPERVRHWVESHNRLSAAGNRIPIPWGHQLNAVPAGDAEALKMARARWNAGFVERLEQDATTGDLVLVGTIPPGWTLDDETGDLINPTDGTRIGEVSAGIGNWRDGKGVVHKDVIVHAALCTLPVIPNQDGFAATLAAEGIELLSTLSTGKAMPYDKKDKGPKGDKPGSEPALDKPPKDVTAPSEELDLDTDLPPIAEDVTAAPPATSAVPAPMPTGNDVQDIIALASAIGLALPPDTNAQNLHSYLKVAMTTIASMGWKLQAPQAAMGGMPEQQLDTGTQNGVAEPMSPNAAFMSTEVGEIVTLSTEAGQVVDAWAGKQKRKLATEWDNMASRQIITEETARREKEHLEKSRPTVDPRTKEVTLPDAISRITLAREASTGRKDVVDALTRRTAVPTVLPPQPPKRPEANGTVATLATEIPTATVVEPNPAQNTGDANGFDMKEHLAFMRGAANVQVKTTA